MSGSRRNIEFDALGQRQRRAPVDGIGLAAHIGLPGIGSSLATTAGVLLTAESTADLGSRGTEVDVGDAAVAALVTQVELGVLQTLGEQSRRQSERRVVLQPDRLIDRIH